MTNMRKICVIVSLLMGGVIVAGCHSSDGYVRNATAESVGEASGAEEDNLMINIDNPSISPLHAACNSSNIDKELIQKLVKEGANINESDYIDKEHRVALSPLMIACSRSDIDAEAVELLIKLGADPNKISWTRGFDQPDYDNKTALMFAVNRSKIDTEALQVLIKNGADINEKTYNQMTPLMMACNHDVIDDDAVKLLIKLGSDVNQVNGDGKTAAMLAADRIHADIPVIEMLLSEGTDVRHVDEEEGKSILMYPGVLRSLKLTQRIIKMGGDIHATAKGDGNVDLLGLAAAFGTKEVVQFYLDKGMNVNRRRDDGQTPLILAVWGNTLEVVKLLVDSGADISMIANDGITTLMSACSKKPKWALIDRAQMDVVKFLLKSGVNVEDEDQYGQTAMFYLAQNEKDVRDIVDLLLKYGADVNHRSKEGSRPLDRVVNPDVTKYLIKKGADVHTKTDDLYTPLHYAVMNDRLDVANVLLEAGIERDAKTAKGKDVRHFAYTSEAIEFLYKNGYKFNDVWTSMDNYYQIINDSADIDKAKLLLTRLKVGGGMDNPKLGNAIIHYFVDSGQLPATADEVVEELLKRNPNVLNERYDGHTPIELSQHKYGGDDVTAFLIRHNAQFTNNGSPFEAIFKHADTSSELVRAVIASGADVNVKIKSFMGEQIPVLYMIAMETPGAVKDALAAGANPNVSDPDGATPLMATDDIDAVNQLIKAGADVNAKLNNGKSVLMIHAGHGTLETVKALIDAGAIVDAETIGYAQDKEIAALMKRRAKDVHYSQENLLYLEDITDDMVKDVIKQGMDINAPIDEYNQTLLTFACRSGEANKIKTLLKNGADPNIPNSLDDGMTPFMLAVSEWFSPNTMDLDAVKALINAGAKVNSKSNSGMTPLMYAAYMPREGLFSGIIKLLLDSGADVKATDKIGRNVLFYLSYQLKPEIVELLINKGANPRQKDKNGGTPLMRQSEPKLIKLLIDAGVDVNAKDKSGKTVIETIDPGFRTPEIVKLLRSHGATGTPKPGWDKEIHLKY